MKIKHFCSFRAIPAISIADHISVKISNFQFLTVFNQFVLLFVFISYLMFTSYNFVILFYLWRNKTYSLTQGGWKISKIKEGVKKKLGVETLKETEFHFQFLFDKTGETFLFRKMPHHTLQVNLFIPNEQSAQGTNGLMIICKCLVLLDNRSGATRDV